MLWLFTCFHRVFFGGNFSIGNLVISTIWCWLWTAKNVWNRPAECDVKGWKSVQGFCLAALSQRSQLPVNPEFKAFMQQVHPPARLTGEQVGWRLGLNRDEVRIISSSEVITRKRAESWLKISLNPMTSERLVSGQWMDIVLWRGFCVIGNRFNNRKP